MTETQTLIPMAEDGRELDVLAGQPVGTVEELGRGLWLVRGKTGTYRLDAVSGRCECPAGQNNKHCWHLDRISDYFEEQGLTSCPVCTEQERHCCKWCDGRGVVSRDELPVILEYLGTAKVEMNEEELRRIFA